MAVETNTSCLLAFVLYSKTIANSDTKDRTMAILCVGTMSRKYNRITGSMSKANEVNSTTVLATMINLSFE